MIITLMRVRCFLGYLLFVQFANALTALKPDGKHVLSENRKKGNSTFILLKNACAQKSGNEGRINNKNYEFQKSRNVRDAKYLDTSRLNMIGEESLKDSDDLNENIAAFVNYALNANDSFRRDERRLPLFQLNGNQKLDLFDNDRSLEKSENKSAWKSRQLSYDGNGKNISGMLRWVKPVVDIHPGSPTQITKTYPVNDDVADFAVFMSKSKNRHQPPGLSRESQYSIENNSLDNESTEGIPGRFGGDQYRENDHSVFGFSDISKYNEMPYEDDAAMTFTNPEMIHSDREKPHVASGSQIVNFMRSISAEDSEGAETRSHSSNLASDVVKERVINLPEPLVFNNSHVVSSFVYTMIPFRSPLLNLLESDKHSKYIMIKIDPVLQPSKRTYDGPSGNYETALEKNIMVYIDKLIGSDHTYQSIDGVSRSLKNDHGVDLRPNNYRLFRNIFKRPKDIRRFHRQNQKYRSYIRAIS